MKQKFSFDQTTLEILYYQYKSYLIPAGVIVSCILLGLVILVPQIQDLQAMDQKAKALDEKNTLLEQNLKTLVNVDETDLDKKYQLVAASLPDLPDPIAILTKINTMSTKAGVGIEDFQFTVASESATVDIAKKEQLTTNVSFSIRADIKSTKDFLHEFSRSFPLSIVDVIEKREDVTMVEIKSGFPHKPFPVFSFQSDEQLQPLNEGEIKELDKLFTFSSGLTDTTVVISSSSANRGDNGPF